MRIDLAKNPLDNFLALVNFSSGKNLVGTDFTVGTPQPSGLSAPAGNTAIHLTGNNAALFVGDADVTYDRVDLNHAAATPVLQYNVNPSMTDAALMVLIAAGLNVLPGEITNQTTLAATQPTTNGTVTSYPVAAISTSLLYVGVANIQLTWSGLKTAVSAVLPSQQLPGFDPA